MMAAAMLAKNAVEKGLSVKPWVKTSMAPGSKVVTGYYEKAGLWPYLDKLGYNLVGYGCATCIGNSGPLPEEVSAAVQKGDLAVTAVLSGNRNFEGRINPDVKMNYLASPPLVIAYALAGTMDFDFELEPLGQDGDGNDVYLRDIWPAPADVEATYGPTALQVVREGDAQIIGTRMDFLGVNYYNPQWVTAGAPDNPLGFEIAPPPKDLPRSAFGWPVVPESLTDLLLRLRADYTRALPPIYVLENGTSWPDMHDRFRIDYLDAHVRSVAHAMAEGVDIRGYFCWSLMDNFEWAEGTSQRFGLVHVDFMTQQRTVRDSGRWFADLAAGLLG